MAAVTSCENALLGSLGKGKDLFPYLKVPLDVRGLEQQNWNNPNPYKNANLRPKHYLKHIV